MFNYSEKLSLLHRIEQTLSAMSVVIKNYDDCCCYSQMLLFVLFIADVPRATNNKVLIFPRKTQAK